MPHQTFETERLFLRPTLEVDAFFIFELLNTPKWLRYIGDRQVRTEEAAKVYIQTRMLPQLARLGYGNYTVIRKSDEHKIGTCGLYDREGLEGLDIGFAFLPAFEGQGYAYEAASRIMQAGFEDFGQKVLQGITVRENLSSQRLLEKLGFSLQGTTRIPGDEEELLLYRRNSDEG